LVDAADVDGIARSAFEALAKQPDGTILAVWSNGSTTQEGFGFRGRRDNGRLVEPVATFPAKTPLSFYEIRKRVEVAFVRRGLLPQLPE
jgi:CubicO group peptidase (beta-lactamase class C family)